LNSTVIVRVLKPRLPVAVFLFFVALTAVVFWRMVFMGGMRGSGHYVDVDVCDLVLEKHVLGPAKLTPWWQRCHRSLSEARSAQDAQDRLVKEFESVPGSHLALFDSTETAAIWEGENHPPPSVSDLGGGIKLLRIPTFRWQAFRDWNQTLSQLKKNAVASAVTGRAKLMIDLRGNNGGSFVALVQALSPFLCSSPEIGRLVSPQLENRGDAPAQLVNSLEHDPLQQLIGHQREVKLARFNEYPCFKYQVVVLVDSRTRSVAEIFALTLARKGLAQVVGQRTAGEVVLAAWYDVPVLGKGVSVSIPEALFEDPRGQQIEGHGVTPDVEVGAVDSEAMILQRARQLLRSSVRTLPR
jgi:hypothetical protein